MREFKTLTVARTGQVATVALKQPPYVQGANIHWEIGSLFSEMREDDSVRVIILTGTDDVFTTPSPKTTYDDPEWPNRALDPKKIWHTFTGMIRSHQAMAEIEKPIIARVNGDAIGLGSSLCFACDLIVAREDAVIMDSHMGATFDGIYGTTRKIGGHDWSNVPGDGGSSLIPLFMTPCKAKEYLMLAKPYSAAELARMGVINYAVPAAELDSKVDDLVEQLLSKGAYALARTKRMANARVVDQLNRTLDASAGYEIVTEMQLFLRPHDVQSLG